jgi:D-alanine-D-alanine ligase
VTQQRKTRVAVVFGGRGPEHAVSCLGGGHLLDVIDRSRYEVIPVGIAADGSWVAVADSPAALAITDGQMPSVAAVAQPGGQVVPWSGGPVTGEGAALTASPPAQIPGLLGDVDVVLPILHGPYGEDGTLQGLLEMAGVRYVGAGVLASAVGMDKEYMKLVFAGRGLPVGPYVVVRERDWPDLHAATLPAEAKQVLDDISELGWPLFVKPARGGSSIGAAPAHTMDELRTAIADARRYDPKVLVEAHIDAAEIEVGVLEGVNGAPPDTSLPGQPFVDQDAEFWDFDAKYLDADSGMTIPAPIPDSAAAEIRRLAGAAFDAVSCEGLARVDFFYTAGGQILINEINTMPGMAATSYFQRLWEGTGVPFSQVVERLLQTALSKKPGLR